MPNDFSLDLRPEMATIRIPNLVGTVDQFRTNIYPDHKEAMQAAEEWFAR